MPQCVVPGCYNRDNLTKFPKSKELTSIWLLKINRPDYVVTDNSRVCARHFDVDSYIPDEVPFLYYARIVFEENLIAETSIRRNNHYFFCCVLLLGIGFCYCS